MSVIPLTVFFSLFLAGLFVLLFLREQGRRHMTSPERDSLLPLADERAQLAGPATPVPTTADHRPAGSAPGGNADHHHDHACACRSGRRPACANCLRLRDEQEPAYF